MSINEILKLRAEAGEMMKGHRPHPATKKGRRQVVRRLYKNRGQSLRKGRMGFEYPGKKQELNDEARIKTKWDLPKIFPETKSFREALEDDEEP
jgi:hypothetical protein